MRELSMKELELVSGGTGIPGAAGACVVQTATHPGPG